MKRVTIVATFATRKAQVKALAGLITVWLTLSVLSGCEHPAPSPTANRFRQFESATLVHQADGRELLVLANAQAEEGP
ncbi:MAG: hypothetical protein JO189_26375, partial [Deltaproteobacteria bacterium]|nr:hypothetical protein [Deltaproteobacteria bacterium]